MDSIAEQLLSMRRWNMRPLHRMTKKQPEFRPNRSELCRGRKGQIELQAARQQKYSIDSRTARQIEQMNRFALINKINREVVENLTDWNTVCYAKCEIKIGPTIPLGVSEGAYHCACYNAHVCIGQAEHMVPHTVAVADSKHFTSLKQPNEQLDSTLEYFNGGGSVSRCWRAFNVCGRRGAAISWRRTHDRERAE